MKLNQTFNEVPTALIPADFDSGDSVYYQALNGYILLGTVIGSHQDKIVVKNPDGRTITYDGSSSPSLGHILKKVAKPLNLEILYEGETISRLAKDTQGNVFREYAKTEYVSLRKIIVRFLNGATPRETYVYSADSDGSLQEKMMHWELEG